MSSPIHLLCTPTTPPESITAATEALATHHGIRVTPTVWDEAPPSLPATGLIVTLLDDNRFRDLWSDCRDRDLTLLPLPTADNPLTRDAFALEDDIDALVRLPLTKETGLRNTLLLVDDQPVLTHVQLGTLPPPAGTGRLARLRTFLRTALFLRMQPLTVQTAKGQTIHCAALAMDVADESWMQHQHPAYFDATPPTQGRATGLLYAPQSILGYLQRLFLGRHPTPRGGGLPLGIGYLKSRTLQIRSEQGSLPCRIDGKPGHCETLTVSSQPTRCQVITGLPNLQRAEDKESIRVDAIPSTPEAVDFFVRRPLPLLPLASEQAFAELFTLLRRSATLHPPFVVLMLLSTLLATIGLYQNSGPVIIGAMILAPLMAPIVSLSMGLIRLEQDLIRGSTQTLLVGTALTLLIAAAFAWGFPLAHLNEQIRMRLNPTLLDLGIAVVSGIAAAYAYSKEEIAKSLAGVAIAVALVPPLSVAGIGLGLAQFDLFGGALLLFLTNLIGIVFAAGTTFYLLGFASLRYARTAFFYKLLLLVIVAIPLAVSTRSLVQENRIYRDFATVSPLVVNGVALRVELVDVTLGRTGPVAHVRMILPPEAIDGFDRQAAVRKLQTALDSAIELQLTEYYPRLKERGMKNE